MPPSRPHDILAILNGVLVAQNRSLLQYVGEAWPWTETNRSEERAKIGELVAAQRTQVAELSRLLDSLGWPIDFGTYSPEYPDLHYVALDFLISRIVEDEKSVIAAIEDAVKACGKAPDVREFLEESLAAERVILADSEKLASANATKSA